MSYAPHALLALALAAFNAHGQTADSIEHARGLLATYISKSRAFDPTLADLYTDRAYIENVRTYPSGEVRRLTIPAPQYKAMIRQVMPTAQARGDTNRYSQAQYTADGESIRISLERFSELKKYASPLVLVVARQGDGTWRIVEERSASRP